jgi:dipicolinate synthase subunit B
MIGYAICGSFCTHKRSLEALCELKSYYNEILPIVSFNVQSIDTRFGKASELLASLEEICAQKPILTIEDAEPIGPRIKLDLMVIAPCTGNTLAKIANGITDTAVTMAAKAHLRCDRPLLIALASNDAMSQNLGNVSRLLTRKSVFFTPMLQDDPSGKPHSLVADFSKIKDAFEKMKSGVQIRPLFI